MKSHVVASVTRRLEIDVGHRLMQHEGKCRNYHGHRYKFEVTCEAPRLDDVGRVVDFSMVKERFGGWLDTFWDHGMILQRGDPLIAALLGQDAKQVGESFGTLVFQESPKLFVVPFSPTAENLAQLAFVKAQECLPAHVRVTRMRVYETPNCWADYPPVET